MKRMRTGQLLPLVLLMVSGISGRAQGPGPVPPVPGPAFGQMNAGQTRDALRWTLQQYPRELWEVLSIDPSLVSNQSYLAPYPELVNFLNAHPEVSRSPSFYFGEPFNPRRDAVSQTTNAWRDSIEGFEFLLAFAVAISAIAWLLRTLMDHRRWNRLNKVQTDVHTRLLERLNGNEELLAYIQSPAGSKFLESAPITLDAAPRSAGAPMSRILWTIQAGVVLVAGGAGLLIITKKTPGSDPIHALGILAIALGTGFVISAIISFAISQRLGLIEVPARAKE